MDTLDLFKNETNSIKFRQGDEIFRQGDPGNHMYVIKDGEISLNIADETEYIAVAGEFFGEMALIDFNGRSATAVAESDCELIEVNLDQFTTLIQQTPTFSFTRNASTC